MPEPTFDQLTIGIVRYHVLDIISKAAALDLRKCRVSRVTIDGTMAHCFGQCATDVGQHARRWQVAAGLIYGQVKKTYQRRKLVRVTQLMRCGTRVELSAALKQLGLGGRINTVFIERLNLTVRQSVAALACRTWSTAQEAPQLLTHLLVRPHESLRVVLAQPIDRGGNRVPQRYR